MSDDLLADLARHQLCGHEPGECPDPCCAVCYQTWPCDAARAAARIRDLEAENEHLTDQLGDLRATVGGAEAEVDRVTAELDHAKAALAGDSEGIRLWMLDCGALVTKHRDRADKAEAERDALAAAMSQFARNGIHADTTPTLGVGGRLGDGTDPGRWYQYLDVSDRIVRDIARRALAALDPADRPEQAEPDVCEGCGQFATRGRYCDDCLGRVLAAIEGLPGDPAGQPTTPCCDLHGINCEPPSELCCRDCTEVDHPQHWTLGPCVLAGQPTTEETK